MSLAQLFYLREAVRRKCGQWNGRRKARLEGAAGSHARGGHSFLVEPIESRILLAAAPLPTPVDFEPGFVQANEINIEPNYTQQQAPANTPISIQFDYIDTGTSGTPSPGLGLRIHYDSTKLIANEADLSQVIEDILPTTISLTGIQIQNDTTTQPGGYDADPLTDKFILIAWADTDTSAATFFPTGPATLFIANWTTAANFTGSTTIHVTASSTAEQRGLNVASATITAGERDFPLVLNNQSFNVAENTPNGTVVGSIRAFDPEGNDQVGSFSLVNTLDSAFSLVDGSDPTGEPIFNIIVADSSRLDFEAGPFRSTQFIVGATRLFGSGSDSGLMTINVTNVPESVFPPVVQTGQVFTVPENSAAGTVVGTPLVTDPDVGDSFTFAESGIYELSYLAKDKAGNVGSTQTAKIFTDESPPSSSS